MKAKKTCSECKQKFIVESDNIYAIVKRLICTPCRIKLNKERSLKYYIENKEEIQKRRKALKLASN